MSFLNVKKFLPLLAGVAVAMSVASSAQAKSAPQTDKPTVTDSDPLEPFNRAVFDFNQVIDEYLLRPVAVGYRYVAPQVVRTHIGNVADNLSEPLNMVNSFLQGEGTRGVKTFWRFIINSTIGLAGINDVATIAGIPEQDEDFGQTLAVWGFDSGPYLVIPILGPSNVRDAFGRIGDWPLDPVNYFVSDWTAVGIVAGQGLVQRERLIDPIDDINNSSLDPYVSFRSIYEQHRAAQIANHNDSTRDKKEVPSLAIPE